MNEKRGQWIGAREAALLTGATVRAMQKRAARGSITARKVTRDGVNVWEFDARELGAPKGAPNVSKVDASTGANMGASTGQSGRAQTDDLTARLLTQLETENSFLRGVIEQLQRDGAETRSALRAAQKQSVPQLTAGNESAGAIEPRGEPQASNEGNDSHANARGATRGTQRNESGVYDYGAICDEIEKQLNGENR